VFANILAPHFAHPASGHHNSIGRKAVNGKVSGATSAERLTGDVRRKEEMETAQEPRPSRDGAVRAKP